MLVHLLIVYLLGWLFVPEPDASEQHFRKQAAEDDYCRSAADNIEFVAIKRRHLEAARQSRRSWSEAEWWLAAQGAALAASLPDAARCREAFSAGAHAFRRQRAEALAEAWAADRERGSPHRASSDSDEASLDRVFVWDDSLDRLRSRLQDSPTNGPADRWAGYLAGRWARRVESNATHLLDRVYDAHDPRALSQLTWQRQVLAERYGISLDTET